MASSSCAGAEAITKTKRGQKGLVNVMNLKAGAAYINFSYPEYEALNKDVYADKEKACASSKVEVDDEQEGKVNINLIDNGAAALSAAGLGTLTQAFDKIPQLAILEMIKEKKAARRP